MEVVPWLTSDWCLSQFSSDLRVARDSYAAFVLNGMNQGHRNDFYKARSSGRILGEDHFIERVLDQVEESAGKRVPLVEIVAAVCSAFNIDEAALLAPGRKQSLSRMRGVIGLLVQEIGDATLTDVARWCGRDLSSISRNAETVKRMMKEDQTFRQQYDEGKSYAISQA